MTTELICGENVSVVYAQIVSDNNSERMTKIATTKKIISWTVGNSVFKYNTNVQFFSATLYIG